MSRNLPTTPRFPRWKPPVGPAYPILCPQYKGKLTIKKRHKVQVESSKAMLNKSCQVRCPSASVRNRRLAVVIAMMDHPAAAGRVYNIGSTEEITIEALADKIIEMTGSHSEKRFISYEEAYGRPFDDMMRRVPCLDRIAEMIGYKPKVTLTQTLEAVIAEKRATL